jgi:hypothetical protein
MTSDEEMNKIKVEEMNKIKVVDLEKLYNFVAHNFFI